MARATDGIGYFCERTRRLLIQGILQCFRAAGFQNYRTKRRQHRGHSRLHSAFELRFGEPDDRAKLLGMGRSLKGLSPHSLESCRVVYPSLLFS